MAYITKEDVSAIRKELKTNFPGVKFSVRRENGSAVDIAVMSTKGNEHGLVEVVGDRDYADINHYYISEHHEDNQPAVQFLEAVSEIAHNAPGRAGGREYFDHSDVQSDYFHTAFYVRIGVGRWDKPFKVAA